jgi:hypothetical protein
MRQFLLVLFALTTAVLFAACDTCEFANDGECDEPVLCATGTDSTDCSNPGICTNTCATAFDGECDDGGPGAQFSVCALGSDCDDCGPR